jgi:Mce-associated membrane protein
MQTGMWPRACARAVVSLVTVALLAGGTASAASQNENLAFVDAALTQTVLAAANSALPAVLSYDYRKLDDTAQRARERGTEAYVARHAQQLEAARATAVRQRHEVLTTVAGVGIRELQARTAKLLVFLDQKTTRGDTNRTAVTASTVLADFRLVDGQWRIDTVSDPVR